MPLRRLLQNFLPGIKFDDIEDLEGWRTYYIRLMLLLSVFALPVGFLLSLPTYFSENLLGLVFFYLAVGILLAAILWLDNRVPQVHLFFIIIYGMTLTFLITLGPYHARPAWLIMCVVSAAFMFGMRAAVLATIFNAAILMALYSFASPYLDGWEIVHREPFSKWIMFCGNLTLLSLMSTLPANFLLNRMSDLLIKEKNLSRRLAKESNDLQAVNAKLEKAVSERARAEEEKKRLQDELVQVQKMEAMGTLAGGIAHDFNNILSAIIGYGQLIQADTSQSEQSRRNVERLLNAGERAKQLVKQILTFSRKVETSVGALDLAENITDALRMMRALIPANVKLQKKLAASCMVMSSSTYIHQILMNLCTNAIHAMGAEGGLLDIRLTCVTVHEAEAADLNLLPGEYAKISVSDTGCGIPPDIIDRIFEPYFTTKGAGLGTGLGLSVVHGIATSHDGGVVCRSVPDQGTTFDIYLPRITASTDTEENFTDTHTPTGTEKILYVDDEAMLADTSGQILMSLGYHVVTTTSSIEALQLFLENPHSYHAVITDMTMPHLTGDKLARKILDVRPDIPIIICSGYSDYISDADAAQLGIRNYLMKPFTIDQLAQTLRQALDNNPSVEKRRISS